MRVNWTHTFVGLPKFSNGNEIVYRVNETEVRNYTAVIISDGNGNWTINNTHIVELVNVTVVKVWTDNGNQDGVRPANVTVLLYAGEANIENVTLSDANNWTHTFVGLPKFSNGTIMIVL